MGLKVIRNVSLMLVAVFTAGCGDSGQVEPAVSQGKKVPVQGKVSAKAKKKAPVK